MRAIIDIKGKQYEIEEGRYLSVDRYPALENEEIVLGNVCMVIAGEQSLIGAPFVSGAQVKATVKRHFRGPKVLVYKMRCKKGYRRKNGYRHDYTELQIVSVDFPGRESIAPMPSAEEKQKKTEKPKTSTKKTAVTESQTETGTEVAEKPKTSGRKKTEENSLKQKDAAETKPKKKSSTTKLSAKTEEPTQASVEETSRETQE